MTLTSEGPADPSQPPAAPGEPQPPPAATSNPAPPLPLLTLAMILATLAEPRLRQVTATAETIMDATAQTHRLEHTRVAAIAVLSVLTIEELRAIAHNHGVSPHGAFIDVYRRLVLLC